MTSSFRWSLPSLGAVREALLRPGVDDERLNAALARAREQQPPPVVWLLGKAQSGKTSIIRALTGSSRATIGNGFQACTRTAAFYDFPEQAPVVRFLDTRGLGEVVYDAGEDLAFCESQAHLVMAVMKVSDPDQEAVLAALEKVRRRHPEWPVVLVYTALHELYPPGGDHVMPWPFDRTPLPESIPADLRRVLAERCELERTLPGHAPVVSVAVDLTLQEDGFATPDYGLEGLWQAIEETAAFELRARLQQDPELRDLFSHAAHPQITGYSLAAAGAGALPLVDAALLPALQVRMLHALGRIYQQPWDLRRSSEFFGFLGLGALAGYGLRWAGRSLVKMVPVWGQTLGAAWGASTAGAVTYALGKTADYYLARSAHGMPVEAEAIRRLYRDAFEQGLRLGRDKDAE
ncbi:GTPase [Salicola sp. Rm-C-2C1-2]|uniref:YcjF family protein n=1 Tax=Salicola sp. Rm-C-2C1-2 TaxID=3141321 RepID=UPI0032E3CE90